MPIMHVSIPLEVVARILELLVEGKGINGSRSTRNIAFLVPCAQVSSDFRAEVERILYAKISLRTAAKVVNCFTTIVNRPSAARFVKDLTIHLPHHTGISRVSHPISHIFTRPLPGTGDDGRLLRAFATLVKRWVVLYHIHQVSTL